MKHTLVTDDYIWKIKNVISEIQKVDTVDEYFDFTELREMMRDYKGFVIQIQSIDINAIKNEFWEVCENHSDIANWLLVFNVKFKTILNWEAGSNDDYKLFRKGIQLKVEGFLKSYELDSGYELSSREKLEFYSIYFRLIMKIMILKTSLKEMLREFQEMASGKENSKNEQVSISPSKFRISKNKKTDFIKIVSAMYDTRIFQTENEFIASSKQAIFDELGKIFNADFSSYSTILTQSKVAEKSSFMKPFSVLASKAEDYYNKKTEK